jgi:phospholipase/carboxylesterase
MSVTHEKKCGNLNYLEVIHGANLPALIMMHGYGASMKDLAPLASISPETKAYNWYFPDGPLAVPIGPHMYGRAWFPIDMTRFETGDYGNLYCDHTPEGMDAAVANLKDFYGLVQESSPYQVIGGFSQGSMMALESILTGSLSAKGLILLSSTLVNQERLSARKDKLTCPIFQSHGNQDMVLPLQFAHALKDHLQDLDLNYLEFSGGHEIPPQVLFEMNKLLQKVGAQHA